MGHGEEILRLRSKDRKLSEDLLFQRQFKRGIRKGKNDFSGNFSPETLASIKEGLKNSEAERREIYAHISAAQARLKVLADERKGFPIGLKRRLSAGIKKNWRLLKLQRARKKALKKERKHPHP